METGIIVAIVVGALLLIVLAVAMSRAAKNRKLEERRVEAGELREEAQRRGVTAQRHQAEAEERAATAERAEAEAREKAAIANRERALADERGFVAEREGRIARETHERAAELDPDQQVQDDQTQQSNGRWDRETPAPTSETTR